MTADFAQNPFIVIWETTRACALRCMHYRAEAIPHRNPAELSLYEGQRLICEYRERCGGSRARAWALTGDPLAEDPGCAWEPRATPALLAISGASDAPPAVTAERITEALREVLDPELGMSVVDLGLIYGIEVDGGAVAITMTLTAPGCPLHGLMSEWVQQTAMKVAGVSRAEVTITFDPPWTPERITLPPGVAK